jgi:hypothetical protein
MKGGAIDGCGARCAATRAEGEAGDALTKLVAAALVALLFAAYAPTLDAGFVVWDDDDHIYENPHVIGTDGYWHAWQDWRNRLFYPLSYTTFYVDWRLSGGQPWLFHLNNVLLHTADVVLLALLGQTLGLAAPVAWSAAAIWGLNPLQVQTVAWATERKHVLYVLFYLLALLSYARSLAEDERGRARFWLLALLLQTLSILSKPAGVTLPAALALLHWTLGGRFDGRAVRRLLASFALAAPLLAAHVIREEITPAVPLGTRVLIAARAFWTYVGRFLWPVDLVPMYPSWPVAEHPLPSIVALVALAALAVLAVWSIRRVPREAVFAAGSSPSTSRLSSASSGSPTSGTATPRITWRTSPRRVSPCPSRWPVGGRSARCGCRAGPRAPRSRCFASCSRSRRGVRPRSGTTPTRSGGAPSP